MAWNPKGAPPAFSQSRFSNSFIDGCRMEYGAEAIGLMDTKPILPVTGLCSSNMACMPERGTTVLHSCPLILAPYLPSGSSASGELPSHVGYRINNDASKFGNALLDIT